MGSIIILGIVLIALFIIQKTDKCLFDLWAGIVICFIIFVTLCIYSFCEHLALDDEILKLETQRNSILYRIEYHDPFDCDIFTDIKEFNDRINTDRKWTTNWLIGSLISDAALYVDPVDINAEIKIEIVENG